MSFCDENEIYFTKDTILIQNDKIYERRYTFSFKELRCYNITREKKNMGMEMYYDFDLLIFILWNFSLIIITKFTHTRVFPQRDSSHKYQTR